MLIKVNALWCIPCSPACGRSAKCSEDELLGQQTCSKQICMLVRIKPEEVRAHCLFTTPSYPQLFFFLLLLVVITKLCVCNEWITTQQQQQQHLWSQWSDPGTASDLLHQALREAWQIQHHTGGQWGGGGGWRSRAGAEGAQPIPLLHLSATSLSSLHILRRAETASHAETNVKINHYDLSCSALTCLTWHFHFTPAAGLCLLHQKETAHPCTRRAASPSSVFYARWTQPQCLCPQCNTAEALWGGLWCASEGAAHANVSFG